MARDLNKVMITGRLGKDVDMRVTPSGTSVATFTVASGRGVKQPDGTFKEQTEWFRVVAWERLAETCANYLKKGSHVLIEGRLQTREWTDQQGQKRFTTEVIANEMFMLDSKRQEGTGSVDDETWNNAGAPASSGGGNRRPSRSEYDEDELDVTDVPF